MVVAITHLLGYTRDVPTVLRVDGFRVVIYLPPREHDPPHVHVWKGDGEVVIKTPDRAPASDHPRCVAHPDCGHRESVLDRRGAHRVPGRLLEAVS